MMKVKGIDVSYAQGAIDWALVKKSGIQFAMLRAGYGKEISQKDARFEANYTGCKQNDIPVGVYWYSYATSVEEARQEAAVCLKVLQGKRFEYPIFYDIEENRTFNKGVAVVSAIAEAFCLELERAGYYVGIYASKSQLMSYFSEAVRKRFCVWCAQYNSECTYSCAYDMWQYSSKGAVNGIKTNVDMNECYVDYERIIKEKKFNGYGSSVSDVTVNVNDITVKTKKLIQGDTGSTVKVMQTILILKGYSCGSAGADGKFGTGTASALERFQKDNKLTVDKICGTETWTKLLA